MGPIIGPNEILAVSAKLGRRSAPVAVGQLLIVILEHLSGQLRVGNDDVEGGAEPHGYDGTIGLSPLGEAAESDGLDVVEVADDGPGAWARRQLEPQALIQLVAEENPDY